jgi:hypothetical protein
MKIRAQYAIATVVLLMLWRPCGNAVEDKPSSPEECCAIVARAIDAVNKIKKDMLRSDVEKEFRLEGGLFSRNQTFYVYKNCPFIKIKVAFELDPSYKDFVTGSPKDRVLSVSKPYLEYSVTD